MQLLSTNTWRIKGCANYLHLFFSKLVLWVECGYTAAARRERQHTRKTQKTTNEVLSTEQKIT